MFFHAFLVGRAENLACSGSRQAIDKLREIFETIFQTKEQAQYTDRLGAAELPAIDRLEPSPVRPSTGERGKVDIELTTSKDIEAVGHLRIGPVVVSAERIDARRFRASVDEQSRRRLTGQTWEVVLLEPEQARAVSKAGKLTFAG